MRWSLCALLLLCGCASGVFYSSPTRMVNLSVGMTKKEVLKIMGRPFACSNDMTDAGMQEIWEYRKADGVFGVSRDQKDVYETHFLNGKLVNYGRAVDIREAEDRKRLERKWGGK